MLYNINPNRTCFITVARTLPMCTRCDGIGVHQDSGCRVDAPHVIRTHKLRVFVSGEMVIDHLAKKGFRVNFLGGDFELEAPNETLTSEEVALAIQTMEENVLEDIDSEAYCQGSM